MRRFYWRTRDGRKLRLQWIALRVLAFCVGLSAGHADAGVYTLIRGATSTFTSPNSCAGVCEIVTIQTGTTGSPAANLAVEVIGTTTACTISLEASNDGTNWAVLNIVNASGSSASTLASSGIASAIGTVSNAPFQYWSAIVTSLSSGSCTATVSG